MYSIEFVETACIFSENYNNVAKLKTKEVTMKTNETQKPESITASKTQSNTPADH